MKRAIAIILSAAIMLAPLASCGEPEARRPVTAAELLNLGEKYLLTMDYEQALVHFARTIKIDPMNPRGYTGAAESHVGLGQTDNAVNVLQYGIGMFYDDEAFLVNSVGIYEAIIDIDPMNPDAHIGLANTYIALGDEGRAIEALRRGHNELPYDVTIFDMLSGIEGIPEDIPGDPFEDDDFPEGLDGPEDPEAPEGPEENTEENANDDPAGDEMPQPEVEEENDPPADEPQPPELASWKQLYINHIARNPGYSADATQYRLIHIDNDGIPELLITYPSAAEGSALITLRSNDSLDVLEFYDGSLSFYDRGNLFIIEGGRQGEFYSTIYRIQNGRFSQMHNGRYEMDYDSDFDPDGFPGLRFYWDGRELSEAEYDNALNAAFNSSRATSAYGLSNYNATEITNQIRGY